MKGKARYTYYVEEDHARIEVKSYRNIIRHILIDLDLFSDLRHKNLSFSFKGKYVIYYNETIKPSILAYYVLGINKPFVRFKYRNGNMYDLRRENIMINEKSEPAEASSKIKGVSWNANASKWEVKIVHKKKRYYLGLFADENLAISAVIVKRMQLITTENENSKKTAL